MTKPIYLTIEEIINWINEPYKKKFSKFLEENLYKFSEEQVVTITNSLNYAFHLYQFDKKFVDKMTFSMSNALELVLINYITANMKANIQELDIHHTDKSLVNFVKRVEMGSIDAYK
jgi:hypothetical protein